MSHFSCGHCAACTVYCSDGGSATLVCRAEPLLTQIKADRTVVVSPVFDKVNYDDLKVIKYSPAAHAFDWALWCMYEGFTPEYYKLDDSSLPGKYVKIELL